MANLISKGVEEFYSVNGENRVYAPLSGLKICKDVLAEELNDIDQNVRRGYAKLHCQLLRTLYLRSLFALPVA
jgi:hypothetical protein